MVIGRAIVIDIFPKKDSVKIFSQIAIVLGVSSIIGPGIGGIFNTNSSWQTIFFGKLHYYNSFFQLVL